MGFDIKPNFVAFDMNGTLIKFSINDAIREVLRERLPGGDRRWLPAGLQGVPDRRVHGHSFEDLVVTDSAGTSVQRLPVAARGLLS